MEIVRPRGGNANLLYPMLILAALAVTLFAGLGAAALLGWLPSAGSAALVFDARELPASKEKPAEADARCAQCGTVEAVTPYAVKGESGGVGAVAGGVVGGLVGNQLGNGRGRSLATIAGAGGGAYLGDQIEKNMNKRTRYKVVVRMDDGSTRAFHEAAARWQPGARVRVADGRLAAATP